MIDQKAPEKPLHGYQTALRIALRGVVALFGGIMLLASLLSFMTSGREWFDYLSVAPTLLVVYGGMFGWKTVERFLDGLEQSAFRMLRWRPR